MLLLYHAHTEPRRADKIPYGEYIVWCDYGAIPDVTSHVLANYDSYFERIHGQTSGLRLLLQNMQEEFESSMNNLFSNKKHFSVASRLKRRLVGQARELGIELQKYLY